MLKLAGAVLILLSGTLFGFYQAQQLSRRTKEIRQFIQALQRLETEISYGFTHLPDALLSLSKQIDGQLSLIFKKMSDQLKGTNESSTKEVWAASIHEGWNKTSMKKSEKEIVLQIGHTLGITDREDQVKHLRLGVIQLQAEEGEAREEERRYEKMWKSLGVLGGALIVILIY